MRTASARRVLLTGITLAAMMQAQQNPPLQYQPPAPQQQPAAQQSPQQRPGQPPAAPARPAGQPPAGQQPAGQQPAAPATSPQVAPPVTPALSDSGGFLLDNVSLVELVDILARRLKINYILDPRVNGKVTIHTYGEVKPTELMPLLQTILRINNATLVKVGDLYRIVPMAAVPNLPLKPVVNGKDLPDDEQVIMNMIFLKYVTVADLTKLIDPFLGEGAKATTYEPANLLILLDNSRSMKRTMDLIALFDSDTFASQRVRAFTTKNGRPTDLAKELDGVFKAFSFSEKAGAVKFVAVDRINTILAIAPNPGSFAEVEKWLAKLDIPVKSPAGAVDNYAYRLKYGRAEIVAMAIMALYSGNPFAMMGLAQMANQPAGGAAGANGGMYGGGMGYGGMGYGGMGYGGMGYGGMGYGGMGMMGYGGMGYGGMGYGGMGYGGYGGYNGYVPPTATTTQALNQAGGGVPTGPTTIDQTGQYMGQYGGYPGMQPGQRIPHIIPNPLNNTLLVQATPTEWEQISRLLQQLDVPPRQVLIEAKIYSVDLSGSLSGGVDAFLQRTNGTGIVAAPGGASRQTLAASAFNSGGLAQLTTGFLVGHSRELLAVVQAAESHSKAKVVQAPSIIATDSIAASLNVGEDVPTLTSQGIAPGAQSSGNSLFTNTVGSRSTGVSLSITPYVNASGVVTMVINQNVSAPEATTTSSISSPSFATKSVNTQVTVQDGDTIALAGIISEAETFSTVGIPFLSRIPVLGAAFGTKSTTKSRTELIIFITPRVIYDSNQLLEATDELKIKVKGLQKLMKD